MTVRVDGAAVAVGDLLGGRYRLTGPLGTGGMAQVFRATDTLLARSVAIKIIDAAPGDEDAAERAASEMTVLAGLNHHALVTLYDATISTDRGSFLVMELVEGETLQERLARGPLSTAEAALLARDVGEALHVAHNAGVVHRDIKPSNILLATSPVPHSPWRPKLADFGIAHLRGSSRVTTPGQVIGTIAYIAPEQAAGGAPAPASDVYSLGLLLIEALTGARPFAEAEGVGTLVARMSTSPSIPPTLDERWQQLLRGMTAVRPEDRPTALDVATTAAAITGSASRAAHADLDTAEMSAIPSVPTMSPAHAHEARTRTLVVAPAAGAPLGTQRAPLSRRRSTRPHRERRARRRGILGISGAVASTALAAAAIAALWLATDETPPIVDPVVRTVVVQPEQEVEEAVTLDDAGETAGTSQTGDAPAAETGGVPSGTMEQAAESGGVGSTGNGRSDGNGTSAKAGGGMSKGNQNPAGKDAAPGNSAKN